MRRKGQKTLGGILLEVLSIDFIDSIVRINDSIII